MKWWLKESRFILGGFLLWRTGLFLGAALASIIFPQFQDSFPYYRERLIATGLPNWLWGFGNFDGVHYIQIATQGYKDQFTQAFFPLFPLIMSLFNFINQPLIVGMTINNLLFLFSLFVLYKLYRIDYDQPTSLKSIWLLLAFPTAFYFVALYSESLFLFLTVLTFYFLRKKMFLVAAIFISLASATRIPGILLVIPLLIEVILFLKEKNFKLHLRRKIECLTSLLIAPLGLLGYMLFLGIHFSDPIYFLTAQSDFGAQRSEQPFVLLPQVLFRYFKILITVPINTWQFLNSCLELIFTILPLGLLVLYFKKIRLSYWIFTLSYLMLPTLTGTLLSMPRFALMSFLLFPLVVLSLKNKYYVLLLIMIILQSVLLMMFIRGLWVA